MNLSVLESASRTLERSLDNWGALLLLATALVVIGLILEYWHPVGEFVFRRPAAASLWRKRLEIFGGILVTVGVAGELVFTYEASRVETRLRNNNHRIEALLTKEAGDAKTSAQGAAQAASRADAEAGKAQQRTGALAKQTDDLLAKYIRAENEVAQLQSRISARHVDNMDLLVKALKPFKGASVEVVSYANDAEGYTVCDSLVDAARKAEMNPTDGCGRLLGSGRAVTGINVSGPNPTIVYPLGKVLGTTRFLDGVVSATSAPGAHLTIFVGIKQPFWLGGYTPAKRATKPK